MNLGDIIIWETTNLLLLIPVVLGLVMLTRWLRGQAVFTERDWVFLFGHPREKALSLRLWSKFAVLFLITITIGFALGYYLLPESRGLFAGALLFAGAGILLVAPKWLR
jgi:hypothetical protein